MYVFEEKVKKILYKSNKRRNNQLMTVVTNCRLSLVWGKREGGEKKKQKREKKIFS